MSSISDDRVLLRRDENGVTTLTLNRGSKFNALSSELIRAIQDALDSIAADTSVRVVIFAGAGKAFCAGHDLAEIRADTSPEAIKTLFGQCSKMMTTLTRIPQPVIARVHGTAAAAGCQLVAQCDLAIAAEEATFSTSGINVGLFCSTPMVAVTRNLPRKQSMELLMTGDFIDADTALRYGLVNKVAPASELDAVVYGLAAKLANKSPVGLMLGKQLFYTQLESGLEAAYARATQVITDNMQHEDARAGIEAFVEKRPMPAWKDR